MIPQRKYSDWASNAISSASNSTAWGELLETIHVNVKNTIRKEGYLRFAELSESEQAAIIEKEFLQLQQIQDTTLVKFRDRLTKSIDEALIAYINESQGTSHPSNIDHLLDVCSEAIIELLTTSPIELKNVMKLFLNRHLSPPLRSYIWSSSLSQALSITNNDLMASTSPSLEVLFTRRCHLILESDFPSISSRSRALLVKSVVIRFMRIHSIPFPDYDNNNTGGDGNNDGRQERGGGGHSSNSPLKPFRTNVNGNTSGMDRFQICDTLVYLAIPLSLPSLDIIATDQTGGSFNSRNDINRNTVESLETNNPFQGSDVVGNEYALEAMLVIGLQAILSERRLGLMKFNTSTTSLSSDDVDTFSMTGSRLKEGVVKSGSETGKSKISLNSPSLQRTLALLQLKNSNLHTFLCGLDRIPGSSTATSTATSAVMTETTSSERTNGGFESFLNEMLVRAFSGFVAVETLEFIWDQCFLTSFDAMLPIIAVSFLLASEPELLSLRLVSSFIDTFSSFCKPVKYEQLQRWTTTYCADDMTELFQDAHQLGVMLTDNTEEEEEEILHATYYKLLGINKRKDMGNT